MVIYASLKCAVAVFLSSKGKFFARDLGEIPPGGEIFWEGSGRKSPPRGDFGKDLGENLPKIDSYTL
jgi:hypothetical protein